MALRRTTKSKLYRYSVYVVLLAIAVWAIVSTDWAKIGPLFLSLIHTDAADDPHRV